MTLIGNLILQKKSKIIYNHFGSRGIWLGELHLYLCFLSLVLHSALPPCVACDASRLIGLGLWLREPLTTYIENPYSLHSGLVAWGRG